MIGPGGLLLVVSQLFAVLVSVKYMGGVPPLPPKNTILGCEQYFFRVYVVIKAGDAQSEPLFNKIWEKYKLNLAENRLLSLVAAGN